jgi:hypothetical protein
MVSLKGAQVEEDRWAPFDLPPLAESLHFVWCAQRIPDRMLPLTRLLDRGAEDAPQPLRNIRGRVAARFRITSATAVLIHAPSSERRGEVQVGLQRFDLTAVQQDHI